MMSRHVAPFVHFSEVVQSKRVGRIVAVKIEMKTESLEVLLQVLKIRIAVVEFPLSGELGLDQHLERRLDF